MPSTKRIALVIHSLAGGGAERLMSQLANRWSQAGHQVNLVTLSNVSSDQYPLAASVQRHGLDMMRDSRGLVDALRANWQRVRALRAKLNEIAPDFVLSFCDRMNIVAIAAALPFKTQHSSGVTTSQPTPLWIAEHSDPQRQLLGFVWESWRHWAYRRLARRPASGCIVLTDAIADHMRNRFRNLKIEVIPPATQLYFCTNTLIQRENLASGPSRGHRQVLSLGRHSPEKNLQALLIAWQKLSKEFADWRLVLAGDGPEHAQLLELASQLHISDSVSFPGWVSDPVPLLSGSDILALTSRYEGFPVAMLEAMACGLACASTPCCSTVRELAQQDALQLAASTSPDDIAQSLAQMMRDDNLRQQLSTRAQSLAEQYTWSNIGPRWDRLLG